MDHFIDDEGIEMGMQNPMVQAKGNSEAQRVAEEKAKALEQQLEQQNEANMRMAAAVRKARQQNTAAAVGTRRRGGKKKKKTAPRTQREFGGRKVSSAHAHSDNSTENLANISSLLEGDSLGSAASSKASKGEDPIPTKPSRLPRGWRQSIDVVSGKPYFYKRETGETTWNIPTEGSTLL